MPREISRPREPVETDSTSKLAAPSPRRITEPLPNCFSIWPNAAASAFLRFSSIFDYPGGCTARGILCVELSHKAALAEAYQSGCFAVICRVSAATQRKGFDNTV